MSLDDDLNQRLTRIRGESLYRQLRQIDSPQTPHIQTEGRWLLNFASNDYLGLANEPALREAATRAITDYGAGSGASRLLCGSLAPHHQLEEALSQFKRTAAALSFSSGYAAAIGTLDALLDKGDVVILDKLVHSCLIDASRLSGARMRIFDHNNLDQLEEMLKWARKKHSWTPVDRQPRILVVTESVFSMDGDVAPLRELAALKEQYGAWLMVDEAHATGLFGLNRRGLAEAYEVAGRIDIQMGTLGKALGSAGGYICGSRPLIDFLINKARTFIFSTAPTPAASAAATAAIRIVQSQEGEQRRQRLWRTVDRIKNGLINNNWMLPPVRSAIIPLIVGAEEKALRLAEALKALGIYIPAVRYPTVARGAARLRLTASAAHTGVDIESLLSAFAVHKSRGQHNPPGSGSPPPP